jgi:hypothetical protein
MQEFQLPVERGCRMAAIDHGHAGTAHQVLHPVRLDIVGQTRPQHRNGQAITVIRMDAGPSHLHDVGKQMGQARQIEFLFRIEPSGPRRLLRVEYPIGPHHFMGARIAQNQMVAERIEPVLIQTRLGGMQVRPHLLMKDLPTQLLGRTHVRRRTGVLKDQARLTDILQTLVELGHGSLHQNEDLPTLPGPCYPTMNLP